MKNIISFNEFVNESLLLEAFQSQTLADFKANFIGKGNYATKLPKGILWDQIPENEIIPRDSADFNLKLVKNDDYVIFWYNSKKQVVKYRQMTYTRWGSKQDNNIYLREDSLLMTRGMNYLYGGYNDMLKNKAATDRYEKPVDAQLSISRLFGEMECAAFAIKWSTLEQYSAANLRIDRAEAKKGALALIAASDVLRTNQYRYADAIRDGALNRESKPIADKVNKIAEKIKSDIEKASQITFSEMVSFSKTKYAKDDAMQTAYINKIDYTKVEALVKEYNDVVYAYNRWFEEFKSYMNNKSDTYKRWADGKLDTLNNILAKY